jgi:hypothetical protein
MRQRIWQVTAVLLAPLAMTTLLIALGASAIAASAAQAAPIPPAFTQFPEDGLRGTEGGRTHLVNGMATNPADGHVFVGDRLNARIDEYTAWGEFVKAWGWGVVASGPGNDPQNEIQKVSASASAGSFALRYRNTFNEGKGAEQTTGAIAFDASAAEMQAALEGLESFAPGDLAVTGAAGGPWTVELTGGFADIEIAPFEIANSSLSGGTGATVQTLQEGANFEICEPNRGDVCRRGQIDGSLPGQINRPLGLALDPAGALYVYERPTEVVSQLRVEKFDLDGNLLLMFGGEVNKTSGADVCTKADLEGGDECGGGVVGAGSGEFSNSLLEKSFIAVGPGGIVYVGETDKIEKFSPAGLSTGEIPLPGQGTVSALAADPVSGDLYYALDGKEDVRRITSAGLPAGAPLPVKAPRALATGPGGDLYAIENIPADDREPEVLEFGPDGACVICAGEDFAEPPKLPFTDQIEIPGITVASGCGTPEGDVFVAFYRSADFSYVRGYGPTPDPEVCPPPVRPPTIEEQYAVDAEPEEGTVRAKINPHFWPDTTYYVQYGSEDCGEVGADCSELPAPPGTPLGGAVNFGVNTEDVVLANLDPATTYHYRFVAVSGGGGPVFGADRAFTTRPVAAPPNTSCPNQAFRTDASAPLPDCRAYEMVSPVDKGGDDIVALKSPQGYAAELNQSASDGDRFTYSAETAFGDALSGPWSSQYMATRTAGGWSNHGISPPRGPVNSGGGYSQVARLDVEFKAFSADLCQGWILHPTDPLLAPGAIPGYLNLYRQDNCGKAETYEALSTVEPPNTNPGKYWPGLQGVSADGTHAIFVANDSLTPEAPELPDDTGFQLYEHTGGEVRLVSILPNGQPYAGPSAAGAGYAALQENRRYLLARAISADGARIFWTAGAETGPLYVRIGGKKTIAVSTGQARFRGASVTGTRAIYSLGDELFAFDVDSKTTTSIAKGVVGVAGISEDAARIYFVSTQALDGDADAGEPNLYLHDEGGNHYIATLGALDTATGNAQPYSAATTSPYLLTIRVSPDGSAIAFMSQRSLTGYDQKDIATGEATAEVFRYDAEAQELSCVSCNPSGARPISRLLKGEGSNSAYVAARLPGWLNVLFAPRAMSVDGDRLFFNSYDDLLPGDGNGKADVYQWEAPGKGDCEASDASFVASSGGCLALISSGEGDQDASFVDASPDGEDVFFKTATGLLPQDTGLVDIYDARVGGGFPTPPLPPDPCESGESCQSAVPAPRLSAPGSTAPGPGNPPAGKQCPKGKVLQKGKCVRKPCPKGKVLRKGKCVKKRHGRQNGRAGR